MSTKLVAAVSGRHHRCPLRSRSFRLPDHRTRWPAATWEDGNPDRSPVRLGCDRNRTVGDQPAMVLSRAVAPLLAASVIGTSTDAANWA